MQSAVTQRELPAARPTAGEAALGGGQGATMGATKGATTWAVTSDRLIGASGFRVGMSDAWV
jgi:hypothetical protein